MPIQGGGDVGAFYSPERCIKDQALGNSMYVVSLDLSPDFESWREYSVSIHECSSEGGSTIRSLITFRTAGDAERFYNLVIEQTEEYIKALNERQ